VWQWLARVILADAASWRWGRVASHRLLSSRVPSSLITFEPQPTRMMTHPVLVTTAMLRSPEFTALGKGGAEGIGEVEAGAESEGSER